MKLKKTRLGERPREDSRLSEALFWRHLGGGSVSGEPPAPNAAKHSRVQDASKRRDGH
jgi:hypothetical protein